MEEKAVISRTEIWKVLKSKCSADNPLVSAVRMLDNKGIAREDVQFIFVDTGATEERRNTNRGLW